MPADMATQNALAQAIRLIEARNPAGAAALLRQAIAAQPNEAELHNTLGIALLTQGNTADGRAALERAIELDRRHVAALTNLGMLFEMERNTERAVSTYKRVLEIDPTSPVRAKLDAIYRVSVPAWHFTMMNDVQRNDVYDAAIKRLAPGRGVLDIGTGAGLLAMMSARAGASWVASCEVNQPIAAIARDVVARNGLAERIKLVAKHSTALLIGADMPERADLLVCEIIGSNVINEEMLPTIEHAHANLLKPGADILPRRVMVMGCLVGGALHRHRAMDAHRRRRRPHL